MKNRQVFEINSSVPGDLRDKVILTAHYSSNIHSQPTCTSTNTLTSIVLDDSGPRSKDSDVIISDLPISHTFVIFTVLVPISGREDAQNRHYWTQNEEKDSEEQGLSYCEREL